MGKPDKIYDSQVVGCGPAALGVAVAADRIGQLAGLLARGVAFIDSRNAGDVGDGSLRGVGIRSNSAGRDFLDEIRNGSGDFGLVRYGRGAGLIRANGLENILSLADVSVLLRDLGARLVGVLQASPNSDYLGGREVDAVHFVPSSRGDLFVTQQDGVDVAISRSLVLATGSEETRVDLPVDGGKVVLSSEVLTSKAIDQIRERALCTGNKKILILGGSHSAFSTAWKLLQDLGDVGFGPGDIEIVYRNEVRLFYANAQEAARDGYQFDAENDVCPKTGRVFRYSGIRGDAKKLYQDVVAGVERRVALRQVREGFEALGAELDEASSVVQAIGYKVRRIPIYGPDGEEIGPLTGHGRVEVDDRARVLGNDGQVVSRIYGIGFGYGMKPSAAIGGEPSAKNHPVDSVNLFHGAIGELVAKQLIF